MRFRIQTLGLALLMCSTAIAQEEKDPQACIPRPTTTTTSTTPSSSPTALPKNFGMLVYRAFEMLDVFGPLDVLGMLARLHPMNLYLIGETMDPVTVEPVAAAMNPKNSSFFPVILPTHTYATAPRDIEVLLIPGGLWTRSPHLNATISYVRTTYPRLRYLISICTGASVAARAGVLDGRRATTNKASWAATVALGGPGVEWVPRARWVADGNVWTSSGVSAGIDATLAWVAEVFGEAEAGDITDLMEYERHTDSEWDPYAERFNVTGGQE
ncbi:dj-1 family protein [Colletotrichum karsti]|uniref:Dj-1 family protein n=1 Tax=Colletotrichum karsti TaxID=1095194 RepID=A0A9P6LPP7_9PEZI|nr:dj-1 family protein [Colletotrichum karsti]KAF9881175.1 dj-1 family protein [Colletotrichum karsti]